MAEVDRVPLRAAAAALLLRLIEARVSIRVVVAGRGPAHLAADGPVLRVHRPRDFYHRLGAGGMIGLGEAYQVGDWDADDLAGLLTAVAVAMRGGRLSALRRVGRLRHLPWLRQRLGGQTPAADENTVEGARRNVGYHYDLSNELFALFLDETMTYSSALFDSPADPGIDTRAGSLADLRGGSLAVALPSHELAVAQCRKIDRLLHGAGVRPGSRVLEIGTGWGSLAIRAAERGAIVHTITISGEQRALAQERAAAAGVADRVVIELRDYRELNEAEGYDAILSVEMVEAVGERYWPSYFATLDRMLAPGGRVGLQAILVPDDRLRAARDTYTWIQKYIFPGGVMLSLAEIERRLAADTRLRIADQFSFGAHYARTLQLWRERFTANAPAVAKLGFDETFRRTWEYYFAYCEAGFASGELDVQQLILERRPT